MTGMKYKLRRGATAVRFGRTVVCSLGQVVDAEHIASIVGPNWRASGWGRVSAQRLEAVPDDAASEAEPESAKVAVPAEVVPADPQPEETAEPAEGDFPADVVGEAPDAPTMTEL